MCSCCATLGKQVVLLEFSIKPFFFQSFLVFHDWFHLPSLDIFPRLHSCINVFVSSLYVYRVWAWLRDAFLQLMLRIQSCLQSSICTKMRFSKITGPACANSHALLFWASSSSHCLAALDLGTSVEQPFDCLIVQNRQSVQSVGGRWIGHWRTTWSTVCSAPHSQAAEEAITHLYKQERKGPTPVQRRLWRTHAVLERVIPGGWVPVSGMKVRSLVRLSNHSAFHWWSAQRAARTSCAKTQPHPIDKDHHNN